MPFNSSGTYTPASGATTAAPGDLIRSATWNSIFTDISSALTSLGNQIYSDPTTVLIGASPYVPLATDTFLFVTSSGGAITINLPTAASRAGFPLFIKDGGAAATHNITINRNGADTIQGLTSVTITSNYGGILLLPVTGGWVTRS